MWRVGPATNRVLVVNLGGAVANFVLTCQVERGSGRACTK